MYKLAQNYKLTDQFYRTTYLRIIGLIMKLKGFTVHPYPHSDHRSPQVTITNPGLHPTRQIT